MVHAPVPELKQLWKIKKLFLFVVKLSSKLHSVCLLKVTSILFFPLAAIIIFQ